MKDDPLKLLNFLKSPGNRTNYESFISSVFIGSKKLQTDSSIKCLSTENSR